MSQLKTKLPTESWIPSTWDEFIGVSNAPIHTKTKFYYHNGHLRLEMTPIGPDHADDNNIIGTLVNLFGIAKKVSIRGLTNCSYRKTGIREAQPDISYYIGDRVSLKPSGSSVVDLDIYPPPDLVIEIASTSLSDDIGAKRLLYEEMAISEYWVVDVKQARIIAFEIITNNGSQRIVQSKVLPGLELKFIEEALQRSRYQDNSQVGSWFMAILIN